MAVSLSTLGSRDFPYSVEVGLIPYIQECFTVSRYQQGGITNITPLLTLFLLALWIYCGTNRSIISCAAEPNSLPILLTVMQFGIFFFTNLYHSCHQDSGISDSLGHCYVFLICSIYTVCSPWLYLNPGWHMATGYNHPFWRSEVSFHSLTQYDGRVY